MGFYDLGADEQMRHMLAFAKEALKSWPGEYDRLELIKYRENAVFSAYCEDGGRVALRIHRPGYHSDQALSSELSWMEALAKDGLRVPGVVPAKNGNLFVHVGCAPVPETRQVDMLEWLDGEQIGGIEGPSERSSEEMIGIYRQAGALAADLHLRTERWAKPSGFVRHAWDAEGLVGVQPFWGPYLDLEGLTSEQRTRLMEASALARAHLAELGTGGDRYGLIHADFVPENLLISDAGLTLIDFDDAGYGWYMFELATALFFHLDEPNYEALETALLEGYLSVRDRGVSKDLFPLFHFLRSVTYLGWVHTRKDTQTAREMTPMFIDKALGLANAYVATRTCGEPS